MEELLLIIKPQESLPNINDVIEVEKLVSGLRCGFKVKKIVSMKWNKFNSLVVTVKGNCITLSS